MKICSKSLITIAAACALFGFDNQSGAAPISITPVPVPVGGTYAANLVTICTSAYMTTQASKCTAWQYNYFTPSVFVESYPQVSPGPAVWTDPAYEYRIGGSITPTMGVKVCPFLLHPGTSFYAASADPCPNNRLVPASSVITPGAPQLLTPGTYLTTGTFASQVISSLGLQAQRSVTLIEDPVTGTAGASIRYTTDGSRPTLSSPVYSQPILLPAGRVTTIQAIAVEPGSNRASPVTTGVYDVPVFPSDDQFAELIPNLLTICTSATTTTQAKNCTGWQYNFYSPTAYIESYPQVNPGYTTWADPNYDYLLGSTITGSKGIKTCPIGLVPGISFSSVNADPCPQNLLTQASLQIPTSTTIPTSSFFLYNNETERDSCTYYEAIGAIPAPRILIPLNADLCAQRADGSFQYGITQAQWMQSAFAPISQQTTSLSADAWFVNINDLNFVRHHTAVQSADGKSTAAIVCNYPGPDFYNDDSTNVDAAIENAIQGKVNPLPCVAFDYGVSGSVASNDLRFLVFNPAGNLASAVDLDGRGPKQIPNACTACHGVPAERTPAGSQTNGVGLIPFDEANYVYPDDGNYSKQSIEANIKNLNLIVLNSAKALDGNSLSTQNVSALIHGWYDVYEPGTTTVITPLGSPKQQSWVPPDLVDQSEVNTYKKVYAPYCRSCHIANHVVNPNININELPPLEPGELLTRLTDTNVCDPSAAGVVMPNSKAAFDRFWTTHVGPGHTDNGTADSTDLPAVMQRFISSNGVGCSLQVFSAPTDP